MEESNENTKCIDMEIQTIGISTAIDALDALREDARPNVDTTANDCDLVLQVFDDIRDSGDEDSSNSTYMNHEIITPGHRELLHTYGIVYNNNITLQKELKEKDKLLSTKEIKILEQEKELSELKVLVREQESQLNRVKSSLKDFPSPKNTDSHLTPMNNTLSPGIILERISTETTKQSSAEPFHQNHQNDHTKTREEVIEELNQYFVSLSRSLNIPITMMKDVDLEKSSTPTSI